MTAPLIPPAKRWTWCSAHNKRAWHDREAADIALAHLADHDRMHVYPCTVSRSQHHLGHANRKVVALDRVTEAGRGRTS